MGNQRSIGGFSTDPCGGSTHGLSVDPAGDGFQVKADQDTFSRTKSNGTETADIANDERDLIHNIYLKQIVSSMTGLQC